MEEFKNISDKNPFRVPENYFEKVNRKIISSISGYGSDHKEVSIYKRLKPYLAAAAAVAILAVLSYSAGYFFSESYKSEIPEISINEFSENYLSEINLLTLEEKAGSIENDMVQMSFSNKDIVDYFVFENIDIDDIYTQY